MNNPVIKRITNKQVEVFANNVNADIENFLEDEENGDGKR